MILILTRLWRMWRERQRSASAGLPTMAPAAAVASPARPPARLQASGPSAAARGPLALVVHQVRYDVLASLRNPRARFFTFLFPILLLVVFNSVFAGGHHTTVGASQLSLTRYFVGSILALSIVTASYASLVITVSAARESGVLKRRRATPAPAALLIAGQALSTLVIAVAMGVVLLVVARVGYGVSMPAGALAAIAVTVMVGTLAFACIAYAVAGLVNSPDAAQPITQLTLLPLYFISGVWIPSANLSSGLRSVASVFPVEHLANSLHQATVSGSLGQALVPKDLLILGIWALGALFVAAKRFRWLPNAGGA